MSARVPSLRGQRRAWLAVAAITACCVMAGGAWQLWWVTGGQPVRTVQSFADPVSSLVIAAGGADVRVMAKPSGPVSLVSTTESQRWPGNRPTVRTRTVDGTLYVAVSCPGLPFGVSGLLGLGCVAQLDLTVPRNVAVRATASYGTVELHGIDGAVQATAGSGSVRLTDLGGPVRAQVDSGSFSATGLTGSEVTATADSGSIDLAFRAAPHRLTLHADSGSIGVQVPRGSRYNVHDSTDSGSADVDPALLDGTSPDTITATADSGSVQIGYGG